MSLIEKYPEFKKYGYHFFTEEEVEEILDEHFIRKKAYEHYKTMAHNWLHKHALVVEEHLKYEEKIKAAIEKHYECFCENCPEGRTCDSCLLKKELGVK